jgi:hypothetical protein
MEATTSKTARAYTRLAALKQNLPNTAYIEEDFVHEYRGALQHLSELGFDVEEFGIPEAWLERRAVGSVPEGEGHRTIYSETRQMDRAKLLVKLDSLLNYFSLASSNSSTEQRRPIGFTGPKR